MPYQWPLEPRDLFAERYPQMINTGLPVEDADAMRAAIAEMWTDDTGGWVHEWSRLGARYAEAGRHDLAALAYGWARFPVLADDAKRLAHKRQLEQYELASPDFPVTFERRVLTVRYRGATTRVPVHLLGAPRLPSDAPVLLASGGVDSWKMDLHQLFVGFALHSGTRVVAFDIPGTGESEVPLSTEGHEIVEGLVAIARELGGGKVAHLGVSMGGYLSARTGLAGVVDAAIVLGGPVEQAFTIRREPQFGMAHIVGNALGFGQPPEPAEFVERMSGLSLRPLLDQDTNAPMLVVNGADDVHIPQHDTLVFSDRRDTHVELLPDTGHCAVSKLAEVIPTMVSWLTNRLADMPASALS
jgi:esterase FrsA